MGQASARGFVPSMGVVPPGGGAIRCPPQFEAIMPIIPWATARAAWCPAQPICVAPCRETMPIPYRDALSHASSIAWEADHNPSARRASARTHAPRSVRTCMSASGSIRPRSSSGRYNRVRLTVPCEVTPVRSP